MQFKVFSVPFHGEEQSEAELNKFLRSHKVVGIDKTFVSNEQGGSWSFCIRYVDTRLHSQTSTPPVDYTKGLSKEAYEQYEKLRVVRKEVADKLKIPAYAVFTNKELSEICQLKEITKSTLLSINGIGEGRLEKVGLSFISMYEKS